MTDIADVRPFVSHNHGLAVVLPVRSPRLLGPGA